MNVSQRDVKYLSLNNISVQIINLSQNNIHISSEIFKIFLKQPLGFQSQIKLSLYLNILYYYRVFSFYRNFVYIIDKE